MQYGEKIIVQQNANKCNCQGRFFGLEKKHTRKNVKNGEKSVFSEMRSDITVSAKSCIFQLKNMQFSESGKNRYIGEFSKIMEIGEENRYSRSHTVRRSFLLQTFSASRTQINATVRVDFREF